MLAVLVAVIQMTEGKPIVSKNQQVAFRLDESTFIQFKKKLLDDGNKSVQRFCEDVVKDYLKEDR